METLELVPYPAQVIFTKGSITIETAPRLVGDDAFAAEISLGAAQIAEIGFPSEPDTAIEIRCAVDRELQNEAYRLSITDTGLFLFAGTGIGIFHAIQTARQLLLPAKKTGTVTLPCVNIDDEPRFSWRGCMLDTARNYFTPAFIKKLIDLAALHHLNVFHWHLTDDQGWRFSVPKYPALDEKSSWRIDPRMKQNGFKIEGMYSAAEIREIVAYAAARHVEVVPEVDFPGHASALLAAYPELGCTGGPYHVEGEFGIFEDVLCAGNDEIFDFAGAVFDELADLFPSRYVHIGGDEVLFNRWKDCPKCQARMRELSLQKESKLQSWITVKLSEMLRARGKTAVGWDEVLQETDTFKLPEDFIVMSWRGKEGGIEATAKGHRVIMTPVSDGCYVNFKPLDNAEEPGHLSVCTVRQSYETEPVAGEMNEDQAKLVLGGQCNLWTEVIYASRIAEYMLFPRLSAVAEAFWSPKRSRSLASFQERLPALRERLDALDVNQYRGPLE